MPAATELVAPAVKAPARNGFEKNVSPPFWPLNTNTKKAANRQAATADNIRDNVRTGYTE